MFSHTFKQAVNVLCDSATDTLGHFKFLQYPPVLVS